MDNSERKNLQEAELQGADLKGVNLKGANLQGANLIGTNLQGANLKEANLEGVQNLSFYQLSRVKTLYTTKLDEELFMPLKNKYPAFFEKPGE